MSFSRDGILGSHSSHGRLEICKKNTHQTRVGDEGVHKKWVEGKKMDSRGYL